MARPRKMSTEDMLAIVNSVYEETGDAAKLKCSLLEEYASAQGFNAKAYDFRRTPEVRARIEELKDLSPFSSKGTGIAYKSLDVDAFICRNRNVESLKNALIELDGTWRKIHSRACVLLKEKDSLTRDLKRQSQVCEDLEGKYNELLSQAKQLRYEHRDMLLKNRYLTAIIKTHLYPAIANEILKQEGALETVDTEVTQSAMDNLTESALPESFSKSILGDQKVISREESILSQMAVKIGVEGNA